MRPRLGQGVTVLVIGPTVTGGIEAIGQCGVVSAWLDQGAATGHGSTAAYSGWCVTLDRAVNWGWPVGATPVGIFPAASLMPLEGDADIDAITTTAPETAHAEA
jgi:hypothetical protein